jgi:hypothetical protein
VARRRNLLVPLLIAFAAGCAKRAAQAPLQPPETFSWCAQPISFSPPPLLWRREGDNGGGMLGVRFVLTGGGGQCISVLAFRLIAERDRSASLETLIRRADSLSQREFLNEASLARPRQEDPISEAEAAVARSINQAIDRAIADYLAGDVLYARSDLKDALRAASTHQFTLAEVLPRMRLRPDHMQEPWRWHLGYERDTTIAGLQAFASDDTLFTPERPLLYREVFWVVNGCPFKATYQGTARNVPTFERLVGSVQFPETDRVAQQ